MCFATQPSERAHIFCQATLLTSLARCKTTWNALIQGRRCCLPFSMLCWDSQSFASFHRLLSLLSVELRGFPVVCFSSFLNFCVSLVFVLRHSCDTCHTKLYYLSAWVFSVALQRTLYCRVIVVFVCRRQIGRWCRICCYDLWCEVTHEGEWSIRSDTRCSRFFVLQPSGCFVYYGDGNGKMLSVWFLMHHSHKIIQYSYHTIWKWKEIKCRFWFTTRHEIIQQYSYHTGHMSTCFVKLKRKYELFGMCTLHILSVLSATTKKGNWEHTSRKFFFEVLTLIMVVFSFLQLPHFESQLCTESITYKAYNTCTHKN